MDTRRLENDRANPSRAGVFTFFANETAFPSPTGLTTTGLPFASFLVGAVDNAGISIDDVRFGIRWRYAAAYAQDDIKVTRNLTVNAGVRWDLFLPLFEDHNRFSIMDPTLQNPGAGDIPGALEFAGFGPGLAGRRRLIPGSDFKCFGPRLGIAWQFHNKWVLRAGYGFSYFADSGTLGGTAAEIPEDGYTGGWTVQSENDGITPGLYWDQGFPTNFPHPPFVTPTFDNGTGTTSYNPSGTNPANLQNWNFGFQHQLAQTWLLDIAYVGSKGTHLNTGTDIPDQVNSKYLSLGSLLTDDINDPAVVAAGFQPPYAGFTGSLAQAIRPFPQYTSVYDFRTGNFGNTTYHAFQAGIQRRFTSGLMFLANYTLSKNFADTASAIGSRFFFNAGRDNYNRRIDKGLSVYDQTHLVHAAVNYELPIGSGKRFLNKQGGVVGKSVKGWQVNFIEKANSGEPIGTIVNDNLPIFNGENTPNIVPGVNPNLHYNHFDPAIDPILNINAFAIPAPYTIGDAPVTLDRSRVFPLFDEDFGIEKRTKVGEKS